MANSLVTNPILFDNTTAATWSGVKYVRLFQWVNDAKDIADGDACAFTVNGVTLTATIDVDVVANFGVGNGVVWQIGPFDKGMPWQNFTLSTLTHGAVHIWLE